MVCIGCFFFLAETSEVVRVSVLGTQISKETKMSNSAAMLINSV